MKKKWKERKMDFKKQLEAIVGMDFRDRTFSCCYISANVQYRGIDVVGSEKVNSSVSEKVEQFDALFYLLKPDFNPALFAAQELNKVYRQYSLDIAEDKIVDKKTLIQMLSKQLEFTRSEMQEDSIIAVILKYRENQPKLKVGVSIYTANKGAKKLDITKTPFKESLFIFNKDDALNGWIFRTCGYCTYFSEPAEDQQCESDDARRYFLPNEKDTRKLVTVPLDIPFSNGEKISVIMHPYLPEDLRGSQTANYCPYFKTIREK